MSYNFPLERIYLAAEYERDSPLTTRIVGTLLDSAFRGPPRDHEIERLCTILDHQTALD